MSKRMIFWEIKKVIMFGMFMIMVGSGLAGAHRAVAQDAQSNWSEPVNLSQSGSTVDPSIVIASDGVVHVIWVDEYEGYIHTKKEGNLWSTPIPVEFPFYREFGFPPDSNVGKTLPEFIPDRTGFIHAFWFDEDEELSYSRVGDDEFESGAAWLGTRSLSESAINFDVDADSNGGLHLVYVRAEDTPETPAGVYYQSSLDGGFSWSNPILIYDNRYFRSLSGDRAHVDISTTNIDGSSVVYITWDDPPFKRNFIAKSMDGGENWETPVIIHTPESDVSVDIPFQTVISANGLQTILVWHTRDENLLTCNSYYQFSQDGGATWSNPQQFLNDYFFCPTRSIIFSGNNGNAILWLEFEDTVLLVAWDGTQWSEPQEQVELDSFPDTNSFSTVLFRCRQPALSGTGQMYVVGCDEGFGSDIWLSSRVIGDTSVWYPPPPKWGAPVIVSNEEFQPVAPLMTISNNGIAHIVWSQNTPTDATQVEAQESIYYGLVESGGWFPSGDIATSPQGKASRPSIALDSKERLLVVWSEGQYGDLYFSWAEASLALNPSEWIEPIRLPSLSSVNSSPRILTYNLEDIIVVYAIPLNENRGIYLTNSSDGGVTWSDPYLVVDATAQGWDRVDDPRLARTNDGRLHVFWTRFNLLNSDESEGNPSALYYATSDDNGVTWTLPQEFASADIHWSDIVSPDGQQVHRLWQEEVGGSSLVWHEVSVDGGLSWFRTSIFSSTVVENDFISVVPDPSGALHFIRISKVAADTWSLGYWNWDGGSWTKLDTIELASEENENVMHQVSAYNPNGLLAVGYSTLRETEEIDDIAFTFMQRAPDQTSIVGTDTVQTPDSLSTASTLQPNETLQTTEIIADGTSEPILPDATPSPAIIEGTAVVPQQSDGPPPSQDNTTLGLIVSIIVALIVAGLGIGIGLLRRRS